MAKWRVKISTPYWDKNDILDSPFEQYVSQGRVRFKPKDYPDLFEPIPEKSDEEKLGDFMMGINYGNRGEFGTRERWIMLAKVLLERGVINREML